jgi:osmotically-inducible protein OsmY
MRKSDDLLREDVAAELDWDPLLNDARVVVAAENGTVRLTGAVDSYYESLLAADDAWSITGVSDVDNELLVRLVGGAIADLDLAAECERALVAERHVPKGSVTATVVDGWVTLSGEVRRHYQRVAARHAVSRVIGILGVSDDTQITREPIASDIGDRITKALERNAIVDGSLIEVTNVGDTVYLDGTTDSYMARDTAEQVAWRAPGVRAVVNRLAIFP